MLFCFLGVKKLKGEKMNRCENDVYQHVAIKYIVSPMQMNHLERDRERDVIHRSSHSILTAKA